MRSEKNSGANSTQPGPREPRRAAFAFIFITVLLDMLALGITIPVLPGLIVGFMNGDTAGAAEILGAFGTAWALMQFLFSPLLGRAVGSLRPQARDPDFECRPRPRLHPDGGRAVAMVAVRRPCRVAALMLLGGMAIAWRVTRA